VRDGLRGYWWCAPVWMSLSADGGDRSPGGRSRLVVRLWR
jgi:hypothetical protein